MRRPAPPPPDGSPAAHRAARARPPLPPSPDLPPAALAPAAAPAVGCVCRSPSRGVEPVAADPVPAGRVAADPVAAAGTAGSGRTPAAAGARAAAASALPGAAPGRTGVRRASRSPGSARLRLATRRSALALAQAEWVAERLRAAWPALVVELVPLLTAGDRAQEKSPIPLGGKGVFVREIERALQAGRVDLAVHSAKDLPTELPPGLELVCVPERADPRDCLVGRALAGLRPGDAVGTGSPRRELQALALRPDLRVVPLRGNVDTRLRRAREGEVCAAAVLAVAGLVRLGRAEAIAEVLEPGVFLPAPGQGALALEARAADERVRRLVAPLHDAAAAAEVAAERACLAALGGGCAAPVGALGRVAGGRLHLTGWWARPGGGACRAELNGPAAEARALGGALAAALAGGGTAP